MSVSVTVFFHWWYRNVLVCMDSRVNEAISSARKSTGVNFEAVLHCFFDNCCKFSNSSESMLKVTGLYSFSSSVLINLSIFD